MKIQNRDRHTSRTPLLLVLLISIIMLLFCYLHGLSLLDSSTSNTEKLLRDRLAGAASSNMALSSMTEGVPLALLTVTRTSDNQPVTSSETEIKNSFFALLYPSHYQPRHLRYDNLMLTYQPDFSLVELSILQTAGLLLLSVLLSFGVFIVIQGRQRDRIEEVLVKEIENQQKEQTLFPGVTQAMEKRFKEMHQAVEAAEKRVLELELRVNQDPLTGLLNRVCFRQDLLEHLHQESQSELNLLAIVRATELASINQQRGYVAGDQYLQDIADLLQKTGKRFPGMRIYRLAGSDFAMVLKHAAPSLAQQLGKELKQQADAYQLQHNIETVAYSGMTLFRSGQQPEHVLGRGDLALAKAQTSIINGWFVQESDAEDYLQGESHWKQVITDVIERRAITLVQQPIQSMNISIRSYTEIFARFYGANNQVMPTETLLAMAQRHDLLIRLEQQIIELIMQHYVTHAQSNERWGINLSANALMNTAFLIWLERQLLRDANVATNLVFEIDEDLLDCNLAASNRLFEMLRRVGSRSSISKFGKGLGSFRLYRELKPDYIKLDPSLISVLERDSAGQQFTRMIVEVSHRLGCVVIAEGVEHLAQKQLLETMYVDAVQGYLIARPAPLNTSED